MPKMCGKNVCKVVNLLFPGNLVRIHHTVNSPKFRNGNLTVLAKKLQLAGGWSFQQDLKHTVKSLNASLNSMLVFM